jgi:hypothetical protein
MEEARSLLVTFALLFALVQSGDVQAREVHSGYSTMPHSLSVSWLEETVPGAGLMIPARPSDSFEFSSHGLSASFSFTPPRQASAHGMIVAGSIVFGATYGVALLTSLVGGDTGLEGAGWYAVPVVGPFAWSIEYGIHGDMPRTTTAFHTLWTGAQTAGLIMFFSGLQHS